MKYVARFIVFIIICLIRIPFTCFFTVLIVILQILWNLSFKNIDYGDNVFTIALWDSSYTMYRYGMSDYKYYKNPIDFLLKRNVKILKANK